MTDGQAQVTGAQALIRALEEASALTPSSASPAGRSCRRTIRSSIRPGCATSSYATSKAPATRRRGTHRRRAGVGVCMATSGPGATNLVTPIADAYMDSVPIVAITGRRLRASSAPTASKRRTSAGSRCRSRSTTTWSPMRRTSRGRSPRRSISPARAGPARCSLTSPRMRSRPGPPSAGRSSSTCPATGR